MKMEATQNARVYQKRARLVHDLYPFTLHLPNPPAPEAPRLLQLLVADHLQQGLLRLLQPRGVGGVHHEHHPCGTRGGVRCGGGGGRRRRGWWGSVRVNDVGKNGPKTFGRQKNTWLRIGFSTGCMAKMGGSCLQGHRSKKPAEVALACTPM